MSVNANIDHLTKVHGSREAAIQAFKEIADKGGFGMVGTGEGQIHPEYAGGLDIQGVLDPANTAISSKAKDRIAELAGVDRKASDNFETTSSSSKMAKGEK